MNILDKFRRLTNYDLQVFFVDYDNFVSVSFQKLVAYYKGDSSVDKSVFKELNRLYKESLKIESTISSMQSSLSSSTEFWDLIDTFSTLKVKLESMLNLAKWMRSSYVYSYEDQSKFKYILKQRQTLESVSMELGSIDPNKDWVGIAIDNSISELDYTKQGGNVLDLKKKDNSALNISTVVDVMIGDNILGKDMPQKIEINDEDIISLDTITTLEQSANICLTVTRGSVPEFPTLGISKHFIGSTVNALRFSSLIREVVSNFKTDDSFKSVQMVDNGINQDVAFYDFKIVSKLNNEINKTL